MSGVTIGVKSGGLAALQRSVANAAAELGRGVTLALVLPATPRRAYPTVRGRVRKGAQPTNGEVLLRLKVHGHAVTEIPVQARGRIIRETVESLRGRGPIPNAGALWLALGARWRALVIERVESGGGDLGSDPNPPVYARYKQQLGLQYGPLRASGQLLDALQSSRVEIRGR